MADAVGRDDCVTGESYTFGGVTAYSTQNTMWDSGNDNGKQNNYVSINTSQPDTESNPNPNPTTKQ